MSGFDDEEEEYKGTVQIVLPQQEGEEGEPVTVEIWAHLAGHFSPLTGDYRWKGRLSAGEAITRAYESGVRDVLVRTSDGHQANGRLDAPNLWGGHPIHGTGTPPFAVPHVEIDS